MIRHHQVVGDPVEHGDCFRTALACLLELENVTDVPNFAADPGEDPETGLLGPARDWLKARGLTLFCCNLLAPKVDSAGFTEETLGLPGVLEWIGVQNPGQYVMVTGAVEHGHEHVVIALDGEIVHDPSEFSRNPPLFGPCTDERFPVPYWALKVIVRAATEPREPRSNGGGR